MKYIDADHLKAKLDEHYRKYQSMYMETRTPYTQGLIDALDLAEQAIDSLQQEQPSLPPDLDEAAKEIAYNVCKQLPNGEEKDNIVYYAILAAKAGAEWMAEHLAGVRKMIGPEKKEGRTDCSSQGEVPNDSLATQSYENIPNDLEEAAEKYLDKLFGKGKHQPFYKELFIAGAKWDREQMMSKAVECIVEDWNPEPHPEITIPLNPEEFSNGNRVHIIIVKEDVK